MDATDVTVARGRRLVQHAAVLLYADRPLHEFLAQLARTVKRGLSADDFTVGLRDKHGSLRIAYGKHVADSRRRSFARKTFETAQAVSVREPKNELYAPILYGGKTLGVVSVVSEGTAYSDDDLQLLQAISDYIAIAVSNQSLVRSVVRPYRRLQRAVMLLLAVAIAITVAFIVSSLIRSHELANRAAAQAQIDVDATEYRLQTYVYDAAQLSRSVAALAPDLRGDRSRAERTLFQLLRSAPKSTIYGTGLWYAPYAFDRRWRLYGPYVHRLPRDPRRDVLTYFWQNARYDYPTQPWYKQAQSAHGETTFTKPYFDTDLVYITSAQAFYDVRGRFLGVATVGMTYPFLQRFVSSVSKPPTQITYLTTQDGKTLAFPNADDLIKYDRNHGGHARYLSQAGAATIHRYLAARFNEPRVETTAVVPLVNWTLHESQLSRSVYDAEVGLWIWTGAALFALWIVTALGIRAVWRSRRDLLERIRIELEHSRLRNEVEQRLQAEKRLRESAARDPMTGLPTRVAALDAISAALEETRAGSPARWAVLFVDLDHFNAVNEALGHAAGDDILREVARRLVDNAGPQNVVGRYGGDEFVVLARLHNGEEAGKLAARVISCLAERFSAAAHSVFLRASIGIALLDASYASAEDVIRDADVAMYRAKSKGMLRFEIFDADMRREAAQRVRIEAELRRALEAGGEFFVEYQPIVRLDVNAIEGFEALVRWRVDGRVVQPQEFVGNAERIGVMPAIDFKVLELVREVVRSKFDDRSKCPFAVNVCALHFATPGLARELLQKVNALRFPPGALHLEITETALLRDRDVAADTIATLRDRGISIWIDDFGTGYSSLSYVERFHVNALKIDKSFVEAISESSHAVEIVRAVNALGSTLGMRVVAEGIETPDELRLLRDIGILYGQGFLFSRPVSSEKAAEIFRSSAMVRMS